MDNYLDVAGGLVPLRCEEGRAKAVRDKVAAKGQQQYYWTEAVQVTNTDDRPDLSSEGGARHRWNSKCQTEINIRSWATDGPRNETKIYWPTDPRSQHDSDFDI
jgi:hypothetical protein